MINDFYERDLIKTIALQHNDSIYQCFDSFYDYECCRSEYINFENDEQPLLVDADTDTYMIDDEQACFIEVEALDKRSIEIGSLKINELPTKYSKVLRFVDFTLNYFNFNKVSISLII